jgi:hypothetical protein
MTLIRSKNGRQEPVLIWRRDAGRDSQEAPPLGESLNLSYSRGTWCKPSGKPYRPQKAKTPQRW